MKQYYSQCLFYALDKWHVEGGYLKFGKSVHWCIPHVLHRSVNGDLSHFAPDAKLRQPWYSLAGFKGRVYTEDKDILKRGAMSMPCMFIGTMLLVILGGVWALRTIIKDIYEICRKR